MTLSSGEIYLRCIDCLTSLFPWKRRDFFTCICRQTPGGDRLLFWNTVKLWRGSYFEAASQESYFEIHERPFPESRKNASSPDPMWTLSCPVRGLRSVRWGLRSVSLNTFPISLACRCEKARSDNADPHPACLLGSTSRRDLSPGGTERCQGRTEHNIQQSPFSHH